MPPQKERGGATRTNEHFQVGAVVFHMGMTCAALPPNLVVVNVPVPKRDTKYRSIFPRVSIFTPNKMGTAVEYCCDGKNFHSFLYGLPRKLNQFTCHTAVVLRPCLDGFSVIVIGDLN